MSAIALTLSIGGNGNLGSNKDSTFTTNGKNVTSSSSSLAASVQAAIPSVQIHQTNAKGDKTVITSVQQPIEFDFKIRYKFVPKSLAVVR